MLMAFSDTLCLIRFYQLQSIKAKLDSISIVIMALPPLPNTGFAQEQIFIILPVLQLLFSPESDLIIIRGT